MTGFRHFVKFGRRPNFGKVEVSVSCDLAVHKSINAHLSLFDTCESVIMSLASLWSRDLL